MSELAEFLLARIAEDEAVAKRAAAARPGAHYSEERQIGAVWTADEGMVVGADDLWEDEGADSLAMADDAAAHIARWDPARVLAECEAKRRIVEDVFPDVVAMTNAYVDATDESPGVWPWAADRLLHLLALPHASHPDYDERWRP